MLAGMALHRLLPLRSSTRSMTMILKRLTKDLSVALAARSRTTSRELAKAAIGRSSAIVLMAKNSDQPAWAELPRRPRRHRHAGAPHPGGRQRNRRRGRSGVPRGPRCLARAGCRFLPHRHPLDDAVGAGERGFSFRPMSASGSLPRRVTISNRSAPPRGRLTVHSERGISRCSIMTW